MFCGCHLIVREKRVSEMSNCDVGVIGSCMIDFFTYTPHLPKPGETIQGSAFEQGFGGKGANQCVAAAKLGASTLFIASLGSDSFGNDYLNKLKSENVNVKFVKLENGIHSGIAQIAVADNGENNIVIVPGSNMRLSPKDVDNAVEEIRKCKVLMFQFETPFDTTLHALKLYQNSGISIVNCAPAKPISEIDPEIFRLCTIFCANETEAEILTGVQPLTLSNAQAAIDKFFELGCKTIIITFGALGVVFATPKAKIAQHVQTVKVKSVDTTGAGDCFLGALAYFIAYHPDLPLHQQIERASAVATQSVMKRGTQSSYPTKKDLPSNLFL